MSDTKFTFPLKSQPSTPIPFGDLFYIGFDDENEKGILLRSNEYKKPDLFIEAYSEYEKNLKITAFKHGLLVEHSHMSTFYDNTGKQVTYVHEGESIEVHDLYLVLRRKDGIKIRTFADNRYIDVKEVIEDDENLTYMI